ncbi:MAG TPA: hypothetical protein VMT88_02700 [Actinomycetes bacterium]|nr:hypothetical protein [Actinomycetes bacterium]
MTDNDTTDDTSPSGSAFPTTLEFRIHGVNNTSPANMLGLADDQIEKVVGDNLGSFWRAKPGVLDNLTVGDRGYAPPNVVREAYSWGGLARNSVGVSGSGAAAAIGRAIVRIGWMLLLPFGLSNVAYWSRRLDVDGPSQVGLSRAVSGALARLFGLGLTLLFVFAMCEVAMDLVASQCYGQVVTRRGNAATVMVCSSLPSWMDLANHTLPVRLVVMSLVPLAMLGGLYALSAATQLRYERQTSAAYNSYRNATGSGQPLLAKPGFWSGTRMTDGLAQLHLAAGVAAVAVALTGPAMFGRGQACDIRYIGGDVHACLTQINDDPGRSWLYGSLLAISLLGMLVAAVFVCLRLSDAPDMPDPGATLRKVQSDRWVMVLLALMCATLILSEALLLFRQPTIGESISLPGVNSAPTLLAIALVSLAWGGLIWRFDRLSQYWTGLLAVGLVATLFWHWAVVVVLVAAAAICVRWVTASHSSDRPWTAWRGSAPGILLGGSLVAALTLTSLLIVVAGDWLNGDRNAASLISGSCPGHGPPASIGHPCLDVPTSYVWFGGALIVALILLGALLIVVLVASARSPAIGVSTEPDEGGPDAGDPLHHAVLGARRWAARAHRAEKLIAALVMLGLVAILAVLTLTVGDWLPDFGRAASSGWVSGLQKVVGLGTIGLAFTGLALVGAAIGGGQTRQRPLGLIWDLICFLPRAAHPFAPPCYAERAVPEIVGRCSEWLRPRQEGTPDGRTGDTIVLSAHSLGSVLAVASLFCMTEPASQGTAPKTFRLLTYGCQLRAYFSRIFPELLGPQILGTTHVTAGRLFSPDPWRAEVDVPAADVDESADTVMTRLGGTPGAEPRWVNLWRRTDYLGFPVNSYVQPSRVDQLADEIDRTGYQLVIATHSGYPETAEYLTALAKLTPESSPPE